MKKNPSIFPLFFLKPKALIEPISSCIVFNAYSLSQKNFGKLADKNIFKTHPLSYIQIDISDEMSAMNEESFLEITVPVLTLNDLMGTVKYLDQIVRHPMLLTVNGYGAKVEGENNFPYVDFINVVDIADNRYEIVVSPTGKMELPKEGFGLYTIIKEITYVLTYRQVIKGDGLEDFVPIGALRKTITLQAPVSTHESFKFHVCLTHLDEKNRRIVDSIRPVEINFSSPTIKSDFPVLLPRLVYVKFDSNPAMSSQKEIAGWRQHPLYSNIWTKRFGLQLSTREALIKSLYNEHEFMRDFLAKKVLDFSSYDNYNDFLLRPESFSKIYERFIHDLIHGYISKTCLFELLDEKALERVDFLELKSDFHDKTVLLQMRKEFQAQENPLQYLLEVVLGECETLLPAGAQIAMMPVAEGNQKMIPDAPSEWIPLSDCTSRPKML